jgi:hypothetical protein
VAPDTGPALSPEAYRRRHEITVTVSTYYVLYLIYIYIFPSSFIVNKGLNNIKIISLHVR